MVIDLCISVLHHFVQVTVGWYANELFFSAKYRMDTLKRHIPLSGQEGLQELKKIAVAFEEKIYSSATSQVCGSFD